MARIPEDAGKRSFNNDSEALAQTTQEWRCEELVRLVSRPRNEQFTATWLSTCYFSKSDRTASQMARRGASEFLRDLMASSFQIRIRIAFLSFRNSCAVRGNHRLVARLFPTKVHLFDESLVSRRPD